MTDTNTSGADVLAVIPNAETIRELLRQRRFLRNREDTAAKYDAEIAKYPAADVARIAFEDALHVATCQFKKHFSERYAGNGLPPIPTPEPMDQAAVAALIEREAALVEKQSDDAETILAWHERWNRWCEERRSLTTERDALAAEVKALREDAKRLDWFDQNGFTAYRQIDPIDGISGHCVVVHETQKPRRGNVADGIRFAIDAARASAATGGGNG